jgi:hypothetical protein
VESEKFTVRRGFDKVVELTPPIGFQVKNVMVDGVSKGRINRYSFTGINADHVLDAEFIASKSPFRKIFLAALALAGLIVIFSLFKKHNAGLNSSARLRIETSPASVTVYVDMKIVNSSTVELEPGRHQIFVQRQGYQSYWDSFVLKKGEDKLMRIMLLKDEPVTTKPEYSQVPKYPKYSPKNPSRSVPSKHRVNQKQRGNNESARSMSNPPQEPEAQNAWKGTREKVQYEDQ